MNKDEAEAPSESVFLDIDTYRRISNQLSGGLSIFWIFAWGLIRMGTHSKGGAYKVFFVVGHTPVEMFLLVNYFIHATHTSNRMFFKGQTSFRYFQAAFSFLALLSTNRLSIRHSHMLR